MLEGGNPRRRGRPGAWLGSKEFAEATAEPGGDVGGRGVLVGGRGRGVRVAGGYMTIILSWVSPTSERGSTGGSFGRSPWRSISSTLKTCITG